MPILHCKLQAETTKQGNEAGGNQRGGAGRVLEIGASPTTSLW